jgi:hypothetical protein
MNMKNAKQKFFTAAMGLALAGGTVGCSTNAGTGALIGGATGAGVGAIVGHNSHGRTASGAAIGGAVGAITGAIIGNEIDKNQARPPQEPVVVEERPPVVVERRVVVPARGYWVTRRYIEPDGRVFERRVWVEY